MLIFPNQSISFVGIDSYEFLAHPLDQLEFIMYYPVDLSRIYCSLCQWNPLTKINQYHYFINLIIDEFQTMKALL